MPAWNKPTVVKIEMADGAVVEFRFPAMADPAFQAGIEELVKSSWSVNTRGRRGRFSMEDHSIEAGTAFFDAFCQDVDGPEWDFSEGKTLEQRRHEDEVDLRPLRELPDWKEKVPVNLKTSAALYFRQGAVLEEDEAGN